MKILALPYHGVSTKLKPGHVSHVNWKAIFWMSIMVAAVLLAYYVFLVNQLTGGAYAIKDYNKQIDSLSKDNRSLETSFAEQKFLGQTVEQVGQLGFERAGEIKYVKIADTSLAKAR